jgi:ankyrin repeat protein
MNKAAITISRVLSIFLLVFFIVFIREYFMDSDIKSLREKIYKGISQNDLQRLLDREAFFGKENAAKYLLSNGAKMDAYTAGAFGYTDFLIDKPKSFFLNKKYYFDDTPIHVALANGQIKAAKILLKKGFSIDEHTEFDNRTPLFRAVENREKDSVVFILNNKGNPNPKNDDGKTALIISRDPEISELLLKHGADINATDKLKRTALHWAVDRNDTDTVKVLLKHHPNYKLRDIANETPLDIAVKNKFSECEIYIITAQS